MIYGHNVFAKGKNTKPELIVRSLIHRMGFRFRLHRKDLPGKPDIVLPRHRKIIFVHGCFWHMHNCCYGRVKPATRSEFWEQKRQSNLERDKRNIKQLKQQGWEVLVIWECQTKSLKKLRGKISNFLKPRD